MRTVGAILWTAFWLAIVGAAAWLLGLGAVVRASLAAGHWLDWTMGALCLVWLIVILKAPWDLYFQAHEVAFEIQRSRERNIAVQAGREEYIRRLRPRLAWFAVGCHLVSAVVVAAIALYAGRSIGYYFAGFYLVSTLFRPLGAAYVYLARRLSAIGDETRHPRGDVVELRWKVEQWQARAESLEKECEQLRRDLDKETEERQADDQEVRGDVRAVGRELETTVSSLTDNQDVIKGIQAFVRLVGRAGE